MEELVGVAEVLKALDSCISRIKWRLKPSSKRRLETDILALCTGLRPVVMVDYGGKMPELAEHLCELFQLARKERTIFLSLRVMIIEDMIYIVHVKALAEHTAFSLSIQSQIFFVDLEQDPPKMMLHTEQNVVSPEFVAIQKRIVSILQSDEVNIEPLPSTTTIAALKLEPSDCNAIGQACICEQSGSKPSEPIDMSSIMKDTNITIPALNGWLLGYPVVYLFTKEHVEDAIYNLSTKSLHIFKILVQREGASGRKTSEEELMSFSVPYELSLRGDKEPWVKEFFARMVTKFESCRHVWRHLRLEINQCYPQAVAL